ncbi:NWD2 protein [Lentinula edodes]|uniref:NWD2 protein n=1 Tax=Lentinula edodes TaxID=5353 RepID=A0A1Q3EHS9_LENED|nr:NWD2 protein [Lentinula edodes]
MFTNAHQFSIRGGTYNNVARDQINLYESPQTVSGNSALDILSEFIKDKPVKEFKLRSLNGSIVNRMDVLSFGFMVPLV